jgi:hypothetical protein
VANRAELVSVLVPTHVTSPHRVKVLLNSFALLYRLALRRASENAIDANVEVRVAEVAKLASLRTEFPLFAADFQLDARLPDVVLQLRQNPNESEAEIKTEFPGLSDEALGRARAYAEERLPVDEVIAREPRGMSSQRSASRAPPAEATVATAISAATDASPDDGEATVAQVESSQARQLIRYLERTREIQSPRRDLVYLESSGAAFGLPAQLAEQIELDAIDGRRAEVLQAFEQLADEEEQHKAYRLLAWLVVESVGIESRNVVRSLFGAMSVAHGDIRPVADDLLNSLVTYSAGYDLEADDLLPALRLALSHDGEDAMRMREEVLEREELLDDDTLALFALTNFTELFEHRTRLAEMLAAMLGRGSGAEAEQALSLAADNDVSQLVDDLALDDEESLTALADFLTSAKGKGNEETALHAFKLLLDSEEDAAAQAARSVVDLFAPITDKALAPAVVRHALARPVAEWGDWLEAVDAAVVKESKGLEGAIDDGVQRLWQERFAAALARDDFAAIAHELGRLRPDQPTGDEEPIDLLKGAPPVIAPPTDARAEQYDELLVLATTGVLSWQSAGSSILNDLVQTLAAPQGASNPTPLSEHVLTSATKGLPVSPGEVIAGFLAAVESCAWLDATTREILRVRSACTLHRLSTRVEPPADEALAVLVANPNEGTDEALAEWIETFIPEPTRVFETLAPRLVDGQRPADVLREAIDKAAGNWSPAQKATLLRAVAEQYRDGDLHDSALRAAGIGDADPEEAAAVLVEAYESSTNNDQRGQVMALWSLVDPAPDRVRRILISKIYLPLLKEGKGATRIALDHFSLVRNAPSQAAQQRLKAAIRASAEGEAELARKADRLLRDAGWIASKRKWLWW